MGIEDLAEKAAAIYAAEKALEAADPNAGFLAKAAAAIVGVEGVDVIKQHLAQVDQPAAPQAIASDDSAAPSDNG